MAEDGDAEYIIPVKKEDRALPLLRQLLGELSPGAREELSNSEFRTQNAELMEAGETRLPPAGAGGTLSGGLLAGNASAAQVTQNNSTVSAPVNIQVHASGANAEKIGESIYDIAERYLLRTMKGVFA